MTAVNKANSGNAIINGGATIMPKRRAQGTYVYAPNGAQTYNDLDSTTLVKNLNGRFTSGPWLEERGSIDGAAADHAAGTNTNAVVTYAAEDYRQHTIYGINWSYNSTPTSGQILVESDSVKIWGPHAITAAGPGFFEFPKGLRGSESDNLVVTLRAGGPAVSGDLSVLHRVE